MKTNYKGFGLAYSLDKHGNIIIEEVLWGSTTNQIALLTSALIAGNEIVEGYEIELDYKYCTIDFAIDISKWILTDVKEQQRILIELLTLETAEIEEQIGEML